MKKSLLALAGGVAGLSGGLFANLLPSVRYSEAHFLLNDSLQVVGIAVIGGLTGATVLTLVVIPAVYMAVPSRVSVVSTDDESAEPAGLAGETA